MYVVVLHLKNGVYCTFNSNIAKPFNFGLPEDGVTNTETSRKKLVINVCI